MDIKVIFLLLAAAICHSIWNTIVKKSLDKQVSIWLALVVFSALFFIPFCFVIEPIPLNGWIFILLTGIFEALYFYFLGSAYEHGDLSLVYPLARGLAPIFVTIIAVAFLGEVISLKGAGGIILIVLGIYVTNLRKLSIAGFVEPVCALKQKASRLAILMGLCTAAYTTVDKVGVCYTSPLVLLYLKFLIAVLLLAPYMLVKKRELIAGEWKVNKLKVFSVALLSTLAYYLVLVAMTSSKVSYVSSVREMSIVFVSIIGAFYLKERFADKKIIGSILIFIGIVLISKSD